jgi:hypothetical protein
MGTAPTAIRPSRFRCHPILKRVFGFQCRSKMEFLLDDLGR